MREEMQSREVQRTPTRLLTNLKGEFQMATSDSTTNNRIPAYKACGFCGREFQVKPRDSQKRKYCSTACMAKAYSERLRGENNPHYSNASQKTCQTCGKTYHNYHKTSKYCSWSCAGKSPQNISKLSSITHLPRAKRKPRARKLHPCIACNKPIPGKRKYCADCSPYGKRGWKSCECVVCHKTFQHRIVKKTCSQECLCKWKTIMQQGEKSHFWQGGLVPYHQQIRKMPGYMGWRRQVFERDDYTCQLCNCRGGRLSAHHIKPFSTHPELRTTLSNGITLCWKCHTHIRHKEEQYEEQFSRITTKATEVDT